jgi:hypothetical protein
MLQKCKIRTENWYWNRQLQLRLFQLGVFWPGVGKKLWNCRNGRGDYLFLEPVHDGSGWFLSWGREFDFNRAIDLPETTAKLLLKDLELTS